MNPAAILALIADLYAKIVELRVECDRLHDLLAEDTVSQSETVR